MALPPADISPVFILAAVAIVAVLAGPPFLMGMAGKHRAALQGIFIPGAIVLVAFAIYLGHSSSTVGPWVAAGAAGVALAAWALGAAIWRWRNRRTEREREQEGWQNQT